MEYIYGVHCGDENCYACGTQRYNCDELNNLDNLEQEIFELNNNGELLVLSAESESLHVWVITVMDILNKYGFNEIQIRTIEK